MSPSSDGRVLLPARPCSPAAALRIEVKREVRVRLVAGHDDLPGRCSPVSFWCRLRCFER
jgi:hypothetical protein